MLALSKHDVRLVSIIVITYNSAAYVLETLESAKAQTYQNIELIVTDDCSTDDTVEICRRWLKENEQRFVRTELILSDRNTGIAPNCNRGLRRAHGEWIKYIAGDDVLLPNCVADYVDYVDRTPTAKIVVGGLLLFPATATDSLFPPKEFEHKDAKGQFRYQISKGTAVFGAAPFINKEVLVSLGGFNEDFPFSEDFPFYVKATQHDFKIYVMKKLVAKYRIHAGSISHLSNSRFQESYYRYLREVLVPLALQENMYLFYWHKKIEHLLQDKSNVFPYRIKIVRYLLVALCDPYRYYRKLLEAAQFCSRTLEACRKNDCR